MANTSTRIESILQMPWPLPVWLTLILAASALGWFALLYISERGKAHTPLRVLLVLIRFSLMALVVWMLADWNWLQFRSDKPELLFVIDRSSSMSTQDIGGNSQRSRMAGVRQLFESFDAQQLKRLSDVYHVRWLAVSEGVEEQDNSDTPLEILNRLAPDGPQSNLGDALTRIINNQAGRGTAAVVFFSDGINTSGTPLSASAAQARAATVPIIAVATGQQQSLPDVRLGDLLVDEAVFLGDQVTLQVTVSGTDVKAANLSLSLRNTSNGDLLAEARAAVSAEQPQALLSLSFVASQAGELPLKLEVSSVSGEKDSENNVLQRSIVVQDKQLRVLLVQRLPSYEFRFLKNLLERSRSADGKSATFQVDSVLQDADPDYVAQDESAVRLVPSDTETLQNYDVFVFGDFAPELISRSAQRAIYEQVTSGGSGCMFVAGRYTNLMTLVGWPIGDLLPVESLSVPVQSANPVDLQWYPTALGAGMMPLQIASGNQTSNFWERLPQLTFVYQPLTPKSGTQVLAIAANTTASTLPNANAESASQDKALLLSQYAGAGRVALQATDETYRWTNFTGNDLVHQRYWGQTMRWLSRGRLAADKKNSQLVVMPRRTQFGQRVQFELRLGEDAGIVSSDLQPTVTLEDASGRVQQLALSRSSSSSRSFVAGRDDLLPSSYRAVLASPSLTQPPSESFQVIAPPSEQANLRADWNALRDLAEKSRGKFYLLEQANNLLRELPTGVPTRLGALPPIPLWNQHWIAAAFVILITLEWILRRRARML